MKPILLVIATVIAITAHAQKKCLLTGYITSGKGEVLPGASVKEMGQQVVSVSDASGFYSLPLLEGRHKIAVEGSGYGQQILELAIDKNTRLDIGLKETANTLQEVTIRSSAQQLLTQPQAGLERFSLNETRNMPVLMGERDLLKTIQLLPGVKSAGDGNSGFYVRGGSADQNLILLDDAPVYNASHFLGFFSTFNTDAIKELSLYKAAMPAQYGGRLSSVLDISTNDGSNQEYKVSGGVGLVATRLSVEGPLQKDKSSFLLSGRRTNIDMYLKLLSDSSLNRNKLNFYDLNLKLAYVLGKKDKISISGYMGHDVLLVAGLFGLDWGNKTTAARWTHTFNNRLLAHTSVAYSSFNFTAAVEQNNYNMSMYSQIKDLSGKTEWIYSPGTRSKIYMGVSGIYHNMNPGKISASDKSSVNSQQQQRRRSFENALYVNHDWKASDKLQLSYGLRLTAFSIMGGGGFYELDKQGNVTDTLFYKNRQVVKTYLNPEPRVSASYLLSSSASVKASYTRNVQNLHLVANATSAAPTDRWVSSTNIIKPELADQVSLGYYKNIAGYQYLFSVETYYKQMQNQIDYKDGADVFDDQVLESKLLYGKGRAYGLEMLIKKRKGKLTGWIGYTLSKTERKIDGINNNRWYNAKQDRTHEVSVTASYQLNSRWVLSGNWVFYTGNAVTYPAGKYYIGNRTVYYYTNRNAHRMANYHRLDLNASVSLFKKKKFSSDLSFGVYNAYGRENAYAVFFRQAAATPGKIEAVQVSLFRFVPSVSYDFKF
ncbi:CarboxypepD_reg-like domain-containing protein [Filimonas lacunae]|uniref:CarboxypepD_reg-like domain-containing protein n=1 Tax=Filimonas lacunae TaxID=477680 RepID=A0A173MGV2_9BACT|nr:TonB-dependent receptor [Filimonas lacunae]BAV06854.1 TonB-dependent receptor [Filimonas lacunae]SIS98816.1 CarboxypepD_reg-like domain-containing protein [Filimonas lacunae]